MVDNSNVSFSQALLTQSMKNTRLGCQDGFRAQQQLNTLASQAEPYHLLSMVSLLYSKDTMIRKQYIDNRSRYTRTKPNHTTSENKLVHIHIMNMLLHHTVMSKITAVSHRWTSMPCTSLKYGLVLLIPDRTPSTLPAVYSWIPRTRVSMYRLGPSSPPCTPGGGRFFEVQLRCLRSLTCRGRPSSATTSDG